MRMTFLRHQILPPGGARAAGALAATNGSSASASPVELAPAVTSFAILTTLDPARSPETPGERPRWLACLLCISPPAPPPAPQHACRCPHPQGAPLVPLPLEYFLREVAFGSGRAEALCRYLLLRIFLRVLVLGAPAW